MSGKAFTSVMKSLYIAAFAVPFLLSACAGSIEPGPMPTGYKYHQGTYKGPAGAEPSVFDQHDGTKHAQVRELAPDGTTMGAGAGTEAGMDGLSGLSAEAQAWLPASRELIAQIKARLGYPVEPTFFEGMNGKTIAGFEAALKAATNEQNWPTAQSRGEGPFHLAYSASPADPSNPGRMLLTVRLTVSKNNFVIEESGIYTISTALAPLEPTPAEAALVAPAAPVALTPVQ